MRIRWVNLVFMTPHQIFVEATPLMLDSALLMIRLLIGACFITHGLGKLGIVGSGSMAGFEGWLKSLNVPFAALQARLAMAAEIGGGLLICLGLATRLGAFVCLAVMVVAGLIGHKGGGYLITNNPPGNEYTINLAGICLLILLTGPGLYSIDNLLF